MDTAFIRLPAQFKDNRIFLSTITASGDCLEFYTDTGGGTMLIDSKVVEELKLPTYKRKIETGQEVEVVAFPKFQEEAGIIAGPNNNELFVTSEMHWGQALLGQSWFADKVWLIDYLDNEMGCLETTTYETTGFLSAPIDFKHNEYGVRQVSFPRIQAKIDGETFDFLFDTGATTFLTDDALRLLSDEGGTPRGASFISQSIYEKWRLKHPEWLVIENADQFGIEQPDRFGQGSMIQVPCVEVAGLKSGPVWFTTKRDANFREFMSQWMDKEVVGALGGSTFKYFTIIIDYPRSMAYFKR